MAQQTIQIPADAPRLATHATRRGWDWPNNRTSIDNSLKAVASRNAFLSELTFSSTGQVRLILDNGSSGTNDRAGLDLSNAFETAGGISLTIGGTTYNFDVNSADRTEPYAWDPSNSSDVTSVYNALSSSSVAATLVIRDGPAVVAKPDATAGSVTINAIADGNEGTTVRLGASVTKGSAVYDNVKYAWSATGGTFNDATSATPTWTRPAVNQNRRFTIRLTVTFEGDGTTAKDGTSATAAAANVRPRVLNVVAPQLPVATAGAVAINNIPSGNEGTTVKLGATVTKGSAVYDGVTYAWSVNGGTLDDNTLAAPTWTRPAVSSDQNFTASLTVTFAGDGTTARTGTSATATATKTAAVTNIVVLLPIASAGNASVVIDSIASGIISTEVELSATITKGTGVYDNVSYAWTASAGTLTGEDTATPTWTRPATAQRPTIGLVVTLEGGGTTARAGTSVALARVTQRPTVTLQPTVTAPTVIVPAIAAGDEGTTARLTVIVRGGAYDTISYAWSVSGGTLDDATIASPTWTRPDVDEDTTVLINLQVIVRGDGTNYRPTSRATVNAQVTGSRVNYVAPPLPDATRGTTRVGINNIPNGLTGTDVKLAATVTKGTGVYDTVSYAWSVDFGSLDDATLASPTWTRPDTETNIFVTIDLDCTFRGTGVTAKSGTSFKVDATNVLATVEGTPSQNVYDMSDGTFIDFTTSKLISLGSNAELTGKFVPTGTRRFLNRIAVSNSLVIVSFATSSSGDDRADLTTNFERNGVFIFTIAGTEYTIPLKNMDTTDNYTIRRPAAVIRALFAAFDGSGTLTLDFVSGIKLRYNSKSYSKIVFGGKTYNKIIYGGKTY